MIDPLYFGRVVIHRALLWSFHAAAGFATVLAAAPMLWQLTTATSLWLAIAAAAVIAMPAFASVLSRLRWLRWPAALIARLLLAGALSMLSFAIPPATLRSEEHTSALQSLMRISYAVLCLKKKNSTI